MNERLQITHTASSGVLINIEETYLGVDLFSRDPDELYPDTPAKLKKELLQMIEQGKMQTLLFTHGHGDHFCLEDVMEALGRDPGLTIISTEEVIQRIRKQAEVAGYAAGCNLVAIAPTEQENRKVVLPGIAMELFNSKHMGEQYIDVQNLAALLEVGGRKLFIPGDAWPTKELFERAARWSEELDLMVAPFPLIGLPTTRRLIDKSLKVKQILAVHLPRPQKDAQGWAASAKAVCARAKDGLPMPEFGEVLGKTYEI